MNVMAAYWSFCSAYIEYKLEMDITLKVYKFLKAFYVANISMGSLIWFWIQGWSNACMAENLLSGLKVMSFSIKSNESWDRFFQIGSTLNDILIFILFITWKSKLSSFDLCEYLFIISAIERWSTT